MANTIANLVGYVTNNYPVIANAGAQWFTNEFRDIAKAIASCENVLNAGALGVTVVDATPTTANLPLSAAGVFKVTGGAVYLAYNDAGTIKKVALT